MADPNRKSVDFSSLVGQEIPTEVLDQLQILGRVQFQKKPTVTSAVSSSGDDTSGNAGTADAADTNEILDHVSGMEDLTEQIEDMIDDLTKDMNIPPANDSIGDAAARLNDDGSRNITKETFDKAQAIIDNLPQLNGLGDPVLGALTGDSRVDGPWLKCNEITQGIADTFNISQEKDYDVDVPPADQLNVVADDYNKKQQNMWLFIIKMLWWNIIWAKFIVDTVIINPARMIIANPTDGLIMFFKFKCGTRAFKRKSKSCIQKHGPINKLMNKIRRKLLCMPYRIWPEGYDPPADPISGEKLNCTSDDMSSCPEPREASDSIKEDEKDLKKMKQIQEELFRDDDPGDECIDVDSLIGEYEGDKTDDTLGASPDCAAAAKTVLDAVVADALSAKSDADKDLGGSKSLRARLQEDIDRLQPDTQGEEVT